MNKIFESVYGENILDFIRLKRSLGIKFKIGEIVLLQIDKLAITRDEKTPGITKEFAIEWKKQRLNESYNYRYIRVMILAQFSSYLLDVGINSHVPRLIPYRKNNFIPYVYSKEEILLIFQEIDQLRGAERFNKSTNLLSVPLVLRLLYATGLRINEALSLSDSDVDLEKGILTVKDSKNGKMRTIPLSETLVDACLEYKFYRNQLWLWNYKGSFFFVNCNADKCSRNGISYWFKKCAGKVRDQTGNTNYNPRLHDLRHTFAVHSLVQMIEQGSDLYVSLPVLSNYLGHQSIGATEKYVRLTSNMYPQLINDFDKSILEVFPRKIIFNEDY